MRKLFVLASLIVFLSYSIRAAEHSGAEICFPGTNDYISPIRGIRVVWNEPVESTTSHILSFFLRDDPKALFVVEFVRHICLLWSPTEQYVAMTDASWSDMSTVWVYTLDTLDSGINLREKLPASLQIQVEQNHHAYLVAESWQETQLRVRVWGYGDLNPQGFEASMLCGKVEEEWDCW